MTRRPRFRCRFCGAIFAARFPVPGEPDGPMLLDHVSQAHPAEVGHFLDQMRTTEDIAPVAAQAFELVEGKETR